MTACNKAWFLIHALNDGQANTHVGLLPNFTYPLDKENDSFRLLTIGSIQ